METKMKDIKVGTKAQRKNNQIKENKKNGEVSPAKEVAPRVLCPHRANGAQRHSLRFSCGHTLLITQIMFFCAFLAQSRPLDLK